MTTRAVTPSRERLGYGEAEAAELVCSREELKRFLGVGS